MKNEETLGQRIQRPRLDADINMAELGRLIGVSDVTIKYWESGTIQQIKHGHLLTLAGFFGVSVSDLIDDPLHVDAKEALRGIFNNYKALVDSGDGGTWHLEDTPEGQAAMKVLGIEP